MDAPAQRAKLELLVRGAEEERFEIVRVSSAAGWVQMRPQRVVPDEYELADVMSRVGSPQSSILKNRRTERYVMLSERERFLWDQMDGRTSLQNIATAYVLRYGQFDFDLIPALIRKLQQAQLLTLTPASRLRRALARNRRRRIARMAEIALTALERINISSREVESFFNRVYRWGGRALFTRTALVGSLVLGALGLMAGMRLWPNADEVVEGLGRSPVLAVVAVKLLFFVTLAMHQVVHGLALVHYGRRVREFGFTFLHGFVPTFYVDVTDIFMASQRARVVTAISGTFVHLILGALCFVVALRMPHGFAQAFVAAAGLVQWQAFVLALYPFCFIEMDGYHVLVDLLGVPTLKQDALAYVRALFNGSQSGGLTRETGLWIGYVALSALSIAAFIAFNLWVIVHAAT